MELLSRNGRREFAVVALADRKFLEQAKQLFSSVYWNSGWTGDYVLLAHDVPNQDVAWFTDHGILVRHCEPLEIPGATRGDIICASKCHLFGDYFRQWKKIIYLDVDILTRGSLEGLTRTEGFGACHSLGQSVKDNVLPTDRVPQLLLKELTERYDLGARAFNSGVMVLDPGAIESGLVEQLIAAIRKYLPVSLFGGEQLAFNLVLQRRWTELPAVYNQIVALQDTKVIPRDLNGIIIHTVSFGQGPWNPDSPFYEEWKANRDRAEAIDFIQIPSVSAPSEREVRKRSRQVVRSYFTGDGNRTKLSTAWRGLQLAIRNPSRALQKARLLFK